MAGRGGPDEDHDPTWYMSRRDRTSSAVKWFAVLFVVIGIAAVAWVLLNLYAPTLTNPTAIDPTPLIDLTNLASGGIASILFGILIYLYANLAGV